MRKIELLFLLLLVCLSSNAANKDSLIIRFFSWQMESPHNITCLNFENEVPFTSNSQRIRLLEPI